MISAGRNIDPYGVKPRQPRTKEEIAEYLKKAREESDERTKKRIAKYKKADPVFKKQICPVLLNDGDGEYTEQFGELCRKAKGRLNELLTHKPEPKHVAAIRHEILREVPEEEFLSAIQRLYLVRYLGFKTKKRVKELLKTLKDNPHDQTAIKEYKKLHSRDLKAYSKTLKSQLKERYVLHEGKIYQKLPTKWFRANRTTDDTDLQCFDQSSSSLEIYEDCICAIESAGNKCQDLTADEFPIKTSDPVKGKIRTRIYYNNTTKKLRLVPAGDKYRPPEGYTPIKLRSLKRFLSRHKDKKDGGKKLLLSFLKIDSLKPDGKTSVVFRNDEDHYMIDIDETKFLTHYNMHMGKAENRPVVKKGITVTPDELEALVRFINSHPKLRLNRHNDPISIDNFVLKNRQEKNGVVTVEAHFPGDPLFLEKLEKVIKSQYTEINRLGTKKVGRFWYAPWRTKYEFVLRGTGEYMSSIPGVEADTLKTLLERIGEHWLANTKRSKESLALQKKNYKEGKVARLKQAAMWVWGIVINVVTSATFQILGLVGMAMLWFKPVRDKIFGFVREKTYPVRSPLYKGKRALFWNKTMRRIRKFYGIRRIPFIGISDKKEARFDAKGNKLEQEGINIKKAEEQRLVESEHPEWKLKLLKISQGQDEKAEIGFEWMDKMRDKLVKNPDRIIIGLEKEAWKYIDALNEREMGHPTPYGPSGAGKFHLAKTAAQLVAMDDLWHNKRDALVSAVQDLYAGETDSTKAQELLDQYRRVSERMRERYPNVSGMQFFRLDKSKMGGSTDGIVGSFAKHIVTMDAAMAHRVVIIIPELPDILRMGEYGSAKDGTANESEQFGKNFKEKLENEWAHYSPDTLPDRLLDMLESDLFSDLRRRLMENAIYLAYRSPKEISEIVQGRFVQGSLEDDYGVRWHDKGDQSKSRAAEYMTRFTLKFGWKKGMPPLTEVMKYMKEVSKFVKNRAMDARKAALSRGETPAWNGKDLLPVTPEDTVDFAKQVKKWRIVNPATDGQEVYGWTGEDMTLEKELRAINALDTEGNEIRFPVHESLLDQYRKGKDSTNVRKIALEIGAEQLKGKADDPKTAELAMKIARRLDALAEREGVTLRTSEDIQGFLYGTEDKEGQLERVLPIELDKLDHVQNARQQDIIRAMDPSLYGGDLAKMEEAAIILEAEVDKAEEALRASARGGPIDQARLNENLEMHIEMIVEKYEAKLASKSGPKDSGKPPRGGTPPTGGAATGNGRVGNGKRPIPPAPPPPKSELVSQGIKRSQTEAVTTLPGGWRIDPTAGAVIALQRGEGARGPQAVSYHHMSPDAVGRMVKGQLKGYDRSSHLMIGGRLNPYALAGLRESLKRTVLSTYESFIRPIRGLRDALREDKVCRERRPARGGIHHALPVPAR